MNPRHLTLRQLYWMQRARRSYDQTLSAGISRTVAEVQRNTESHPQPFELDRFHVWNIPEFEQEAAKKPTQPTISVRELKQEYEACVRQRGRRLT
jgi:hypothetical protein